MAILGTGGGAPSQKKKTTAGSPSGWYNIQEFLGANQQDPAVKQRLEEQATGQLEQAKQQTGMYDEAGALQPFDAQDYVTQASPWDEGSFQEMLGGGLDKDEKSKIQQGLTQEAGQQVNPESVFQDVPNPFSGMKEGDFGSIMNWYGGPKEQTSQYTPGMQKMDEMLLRGHKGFTTDFPKQQQDAFQGVKDERTSRVGDIQTAQEQAAGPTGTVATEKQAWQTGIGNFLGGQQQKIALENQSQQNLYDHMTGKQQEGTVESSKSAIPIQDWINVQKYKEYDPSQVGTPVSPTTGKVLNYARALGVQGVNPWDYIQMSHDIAPTEGMAAMEVLGSQQGIDDYNALSQLYDQSGEAGGYGQFAGQDVWENPTWEFDREGFEGQIKDIAKRYGIAGIDKGIADLSDTESIVLPYGETPESFLEKFDKGAFSLMADRAQKFRDRAYRAPSVATSPYGEIALDDPRAGKYHYGNYHYL